MRTMIAMIAAVGLLAVLAGPAMADTTSQRDVQAAMDGYLANQPADASLVGGAGSAGYDAGFWIRGGDFDLKINLTIQARFEAFNWDLVEPTPGGDLSGWSLPRATVKFSGHAPCNICYYMEMDYGHFGSDVARLRNPSTNVNLPPVAVPPPAVNNFNLGPTRYGLNGGVDFQSRNYENTREAWIEWCPCPTFNFRMGQILTPNTRQLMTAPELQQFVDISLASAFTGHLMSGYTDRNRDHGVMVHGALGCNGDWQYMVAITNGDGGDSIRNVLDNRTDDNIAASGRLNWAFLAPTYYEEGALRQKTCTWYGEVGAWAYFYADRLDKPHRKAGDTLNFGVDLALGYGGFSFTGAFTLGKVSKIEFPAVANDVKSTAYMAQLGYLFCGTAWEIAARYSSIQVKQDVGFDGTLTEIAGAINYYLNGHGNKMSLDVTFLKEKAGSSNLGFFDTYTGIQPLNGVDDKAILIRFQWQLAL